MSHQSLTDNPPQVIRSPWRDFLHAFVRNPLALVSGGFVLLLILVAIFAPWLAPWDPMAPDWMALSSPPSAAHWMGTDELGRDLLSRIIYGARISLYVGVLSVTLGMIVGVVLGLLAAQLATALVRRVRVRS